MNRLLKLGVVIVSMVLVILAGCGQQATPTVNTAIVMSLRSEPEVLAVGDSMLLITLTDANGKPVDGATLQVRGDMDHAGMMPVEGSSSASTNGEYRVPFAWSMGGGWIVTVTANLSDGSIASQTFSLSVSAVSDQSIINQHSG